ncbi:MAG TPA: histidine phosphatase family protein [Ramlibacter sp.]|jgi:hypothetical protein|nr:histidine phosphatase family protein [Ramlibacter sp.]
MPNIALVRTACCALPAALLTACAVPPPQATTAAVAAPRPVTLLIVRHAETDASQPATLPLSADGQARAERLAETVRSMRFTHLIATHTTRARQMFDHIAATQRLPVVQLPAPGATWEGQPVNDQTSRRAPIEPVAQALLKLPPGSVALVALNSENIYAILNRLGVPQVPAGQSCAPGAMCVPCTDNTCYPRNDFDHLWHVVLQPGQPGPISFSELRYATGWQVRPAR